MIEQTIGSYEKGIWPASIASEAGPAGGAQAFATPVADYVAAGHSLFDGSISWPIMIVREEKLAHNIAVLAEFCQRHGLDFAPHGKTSMSPALFTRQIEAGAWGITLATAQQAWVAFDHGVQRVLVANQILDSRALDAIATMLVADPAREFACLVDSAEGVQAVADAAAAAPQLSGGFAVLIDIGWSGGRTGVRTGAEAIELARSVAANPHLRLVGVSSYEGGLKTPDAVRRYFAELREAVDAIVEEGLAEGFAGGRPVVTAGGSAYFDLVASELSGEWARGHNLQLILRSGAYASHDDGAYVAKTPFSRIPEQGHLEAAIEVWAQVISAPEAGLAIAGMGKRDAPYDLGMPIPLRVRRAGSTTIEDVAGRAEVPAMDDQHAYITLKDGLEVRPGDLICFGISHPCTAFDKWRVLPVVDANDRVVELLTTYF